MRIVFSVLIILAQVSFATVVRGQDAKPAANIDGFRKIVAPFLSQHCTRCHGPEKREAGLTLHQIEADLLTGKDLGKWHRVLNRLRTGEMPPEDEPRPPADAT